MATAFNLLIYLNHDMIVFRDFSIKKIIVAKKKTASENQFLDFTKNFLINVWSMPTKKLLRCFVHVLKIKHVNLISSKIYLLYVKQNKKI